jgi:hypothetical protein
MDALAEFAGPLIKRRAAGPGNRDHGALAVQRGGDRAADATARASDERLLSGKVKHPKIS